MLLRRKSYWRLLFLLAILSLTSPADAQEEIDLRKADLESIERHLDNAALKLNRRSTKLFSHLIAQERKAFKYLSRVDTSAVNKSFQPVPNLALVYPDTHNIFSSFYSGRIDTLQTALKFINLTLMSDDVRRLAGKLKELNRKVSEAEQLKKLFVLRRRLLCEHVAKAGQLKHLSRYNSKVSRYLKQLDEVKAIVNNPSLSEKRLISLLCQIPSFKGFFAKSSRLSRLFSLPGGNDGAFSAPGIQTRELLEKQMINKFGSSASVHQILETNVGSAQSELLQLKNILLKRKHGSFSNTVSDIDQSEHGASYARTMSFVKRLKYGGNIQTQKSIAYFPVTSDIAFTIGYKLSDANTIGIGLAYKIGLGTGWKNVAISHQGVGLRSYVDLKLYGSVYLLGAYEQNFRSVIRSIQELRSTKRWMSSGLIGVKKSYSVGKKMNGNVQLLWDFLAYGKEVNVPPILFRIGYEIK